MGYNIIWHCSKEHDSIVHESTEYDSKVHDSKELDTKVHEGLTLSYAASQWSTDKKMIKLAQHPNLNFKGSIANYTNGHQYMTSH